MSMCNRKNSRPFNEFCSFPSVNPLLWFQGPELDCFKQASVFSKTALKTHCSPPAQHRTAARQD